MVEALAKAGARVAILDINKESAEKQANRIKSQSGVETLAVQVDASSKVQ